MHGSGPVGLAVRYASGLAACALLPFLLAGLHGHLGGSARWLFGATGALVILAIAGVLVMAQRHFNALRRGVQEGRWTEVELEPLRLELERPRWRIAAWLSLGLYAATLLVHPLGAPALWSSALIFPMAGYAALKQVVRRPRAAMFAGLE